jgi:chitin deacetylase
MKRRTLYLAGAAVVTLVAAGVLWRASGSTDFQALGEIVPRVETSRRVVALTFDDGPTPEGTREVLNILREKNVRATFFVTGRELEGHMAEGRDIVAAGHELGNHSYSHARMVFVSPSFVRREVERTDELIREAGHTGEVYFRPPYGKKLLVLPLYLSRHGRKTVTWDVAPDSDPAAAQDSESLKRYVSERARPGSIILLHVMYPGRAESMKALAGIIDNLQRDGYHLVTVSELLNSAD